MNHMRDIRRILVIKLADLGDMLLADPALRSLRSGHPNAQIDILTNASTVPLAQIIAPWADIVALESTGRSTASKLASTLRVGAKLASKRYDMAIFLHHLTTERGATRQRMLATAIRARESIGLDNGRGQHLTAKVLDPGFGIRHEAELFVNVAQAAGGTAVEPIPQITPSGTPPPMHQPYAIIAPTTGPYAPAREWEPERFGTIAHWLQESHGLQPIVIGTNSAQPIAEHIRSIATTAQDLTGQTSIVELIELMQHAALVVSNDSLPAHLASALDRPSVTIFGPSNVTSWRPARSMLQILGDMSPAKHLVVSATLPCSPCLYTGYRLGRRAGCPARTCLKMVSVEHVKLAIERVMGETR